MPACNATTRSGQPCRAQAVAGSDRCFAHRDELPTELVQTFVAMLRAGNYPEIAAKAAGLLPDRLPAELRAQVETALAEGEARAVARIAAAASDNWQAAAWLLERQHPERWGRPAIRQEDKPPPLVSRDRLDELAAKRTARRGGG